MATATATATTRKRGRPPGKTSDRDDCVVKLDRALVSRAKVLAGYHKKHLAEMLSTLLVSPVNSAWAAMVRQIEAEER
jgi:hypothetical protein